METRRLGKTEHKSTIVTFGALKPLLNRILVPSAGAVGGAAGPGGVSEADIEAEEEGEVEVQLSFLGSSQEEKLRLM